MKWDIAIGQRWRLIEKCRKSQKQFRDEDVFAVHESHSNSNEFGMSEKATTRKKRRSICHHFFQMFSSQTNATYTFLFDFTALDITDNYSNFIVPMPPLVRALFDNKSNK